MTVFIVIQVYAKEKYLCTPINMFNNNSFAMEKTNDNKQYAKPNF